MVTSARTQFRKAQLQAKRSAETAKRKERQLLFSGVGDGESGRRRAQENFSHEDIVKNASNDVTSALRRTHQLMQAELSKSQFAQETLGKEVPRASGNKGCRIVVDKITNYSTKNNLRMP